MTTIFLDLNDKIYIIKSLTYNFTSKTYKIDTEKLETWENLLFLSFRIYEVRSYRKPFQESSSNKGYEHVPYNLKIWQIAEWTQLKSFYIDLVTRRRIRELTFTVTGKHFLFKENT